MFRKECGFDSLHGHHHDAPAQTKTGVEHRIPLSKQAVDLLEQIRAGRKTGIVFSGTKPGKPMSNGAMLAVVERMTKAGLIENGTVTPHGMARAGSNRGRRSKTATTRT